MRSKKMTIYTKEFYKLNLLTDLHEVTKISNYAYTKDESYYKKLYNRVSDLYEKNARNNPCYKDVFEELRELEEYCNIAGITDEERENRMKMLEAFKAVNKERIENGKFIEFDKELFDKNFKEMQENRISVCSRLPETILEKIADIRVFALGYATPEVKKLLRTYCKELSDELAEVKKIAYRQTVFAEMKLHKVIDVDELNENCDSDLLSLENKNGDIYIGIDDFYFIVKNGEVIEGADRKIYTFDEFDPTKPWSRILAAELHYDGTKFELDFLVCDSNDNLENGLWYLTVRGSSIEKKYQ